MEPEAILDALCVVGQQIRQRREELEALVDHRQVLVAKLRSEGYTLMQCARAAGVNPRAIANRDQRRGPRF